MSFGYEDFLKTGKAVRIKQILAHPTNQAEMIELNSKGRPPAERIGDRVIEKGILLEDNERRFVGRMIADRMRDLGFEVDSKDIPIENGHLFKTGATYAKI